MDLSTATPSEIDTALGEIYNRLYRTWDQIDQVTKWIADYEKGLAKFREGRRAYSSYTEDGLEDLRVRLEDARAKAEAIKDECEPYEAEYTRRGGWSRFFLVSNNGGHIHSSMHCSTCFPTTRFGWLPQESGKDEAAAVAAHGAILCTVCFPSAPTEWTDRHDDSVCPGSGGGPDWDQPSRKGYAYGNWGTCPECGERVSFTNSRSVYRLRKHKKKA